MQHSVEQWNCHPLRCPGLGEAEPQWSHLLQSCAALGPSFVPVSWVSVPHRLDLPIFTRETSTVANHPNTIAPLATSWRTVSCWGSSKPTRAQAQLRAAQVYAVFPTIWEQLKWRWSSIRLWSCFIKSFFWSPVDVDLLERLGWL